MIFEGEGFYAVSGFFKFHETSHNLNCFKTVAENFGGRNWSTHNIYRILSNCWKYLNELSNVTKLPIFHIIFLITCIAEIFDFK